MAAKYPGVFSYAYVANNPIRNIDPDGRVIVDATGKPITYPTKTGWSANATADAMRMGSAMMKTRTGTAQWNKMVNSSTKIQYKATL